MCIRSLTLLHPRTVTETLLTSCVRALTLPSYSRLDASDRITSSRNCQYKGEAVRVCPALHSSVFLCHLLQKMYVVLSLKALGCFFFFFPQSRDSTFSLVGGKNAIALSYGANVCPLPIYCISLNFGNIQLWKLSLL